MPAPRTTNPQSLRHLQEAYINYRRYESFLDEPQNLHWAVVLLFYSAVHLVDAYVAGKHPDVKITKHEDRDNYIANQMSAITREYAKLKSASRGARYTFAEYDRARSIRLAEECFRPFAYLRAKPDFGGTFPSLQILQSSKIYENPPSGIVTGRRVRFALVRRANVLNVFESRVRRSGRG